MLKAVAMSEMASDPLHNHLVYPADRRPWFSVRWPYLVAGVVLALGPVIAAWIYYFAFGLPELPASPRVVEPYASNPHGFPLWLRASHFINLFLMVLLVRSGLQILHDHPRLYWNDHSTPGSDWLRVTPLDVPRDRVWTAKDDSRYLSPWIGLPGFRHTIGLARHWHFLCAAFWLANGLIFVGLLFGTGQWRRLIPTDLIIFRHAWAVMVHYATFHLPLEPDGFYHYNPLQQLAYAGVVLLIAPVTLLTGLAMSPAIDSRFLWYPRLFGGRQKARSLHFLALCGYAAFLVPHVTMVVITGLRQNMNHIVVGTDDRQSTGLIWGLVGLSGVAVACYAAHWISWHRPRWLQMTFRRVLGPFQKNVVNRLRSRYRFTKDDISPYFWPNGKMPTSSEWSALGNGRRESFSLPVTGLVQNPVTLSIDDMHALGRQEQITMHHCIQGWSGIAQWAGLPMARLIELVQPLPEAGAVVFHSFGEGHYGGPYYDTLTMQNALHPETLLAYEMNYEPLPDLHGAPLRLRVENQLGYKMVKWIRAIEFVASEKDVGRGYGGKNEDDEYYPVVANI
ncbi:MAG TPA: molybdopterin-dependent oxidoreductase [Pirellulales bacterium]|nr:molybdopterin-dependent oxidoreductase [Pirellulales bacterium]